MLSKSPFSADDRAKRPNRVDPAAHRPLGELDDTYHTAGAREPVAAQERVKHIAVRDVSGPLADEEPVHAFMVPNKYLARNAANRMPPKRPLGIRSAGLAGRRQAAKMYSQVAAFDSPMQRIRRPRTAIPVEERSSDGESWFDRVKYTTALIVALVVAGALFASDKLKMAWQFVAGKFHSLVVGPTRTTYGMMRGTSVKRYGIEQSRFRIIAPVALILLLFGVALFNGLVGENLFPGRGGSGGGGDAQQGSAVLQVTPGSSGSKGSGSGSATTTQQGGNDTPQAAGQSAQAINTAAGGLQSSSSSSLGGGASPIGGMGGGSVPTPDGTHSGGVTSPAPPVLGGGSTSVPTIPAPTTSGGGVTTSPVSLPPVQVQVPTDINIPVNTGATVPGATVTDKSGKTIVGTSPITVTGN